MRLGLYPEPCPPHEGGHRNVKLLRVRRPQRHSRPSCVRRVMPVRSALPGVFHIDLPWTNAWLLARDGDAMLIDSGTCRDRRALVAALEQVLPSGFHLRAVLLTHAHIDHAGNAAYLAERYEARLYAHAFESP